MRVPCAGLGGLRFGAGSDSSAWSACGHARTLVMTARDMRLRQTPGADPSEASAFAACGQLVAF